MPTVVRKPSSRKRRPREMESLTEPPLESSTMVAPARSRPRTNSSKSRGESDVTMPIALTQPVQLGSQAIQENFIGSLRSSSVPPARAELPSVATAAGTATDSAAVATSTKPRRLCDLKSLKLVPSPSRKAGVTAPNRHPRFYHMGVMKMVSGQLRIVHSDLLRCSLMAIGFCKSVAQLSNRRSSLLWNSADVRL